MGGQHFLEESIYFVYRSRNTMTQDQFLLQNNDCGVRILWGSKYFLTLASGFLVLSALLSCTNRLADVHLNIFMVFASLSLSLEW